MNDHVRSARASLPIVYSMFEPAALGEILSARYLGGRACSCELVSRSWTDVYRLRVDGTSYAGRVWRHGFHERAEIEYGAAMLGALRRRGSVHAPLPLQCVDGDHVSTLDAPEGERCVALFDWLDGRPIGASLTADDARRCGTLLAALQRDAHEAADAGARRGAARDWRARLPRLATVIEARGVDAGRFVAAVERVLTTVEQLESSGLPLGATHGDFHQNNVLRQPSGDLAVIDFDDAGRGAWVRDVAAFAWALDHLHQPPAHLDAFLQGYAALRPLSADEHAALPWFLAERDCWALLGWAVSIDVVGDSQGRLPGMIRNARARMDALGA